MMHTEAITRPIVSMIHATDAATWGSVRCEFTDVVELDYTSLVGGEPETISADQLIKRWRGLLPGFDSTQHMLGAFSITLDDNNKNLAAVGSHVRATHYIPDVPEGSTWTVAGHYNFQLIQQTDCLLIKAMQLLVFYQEGNLHLPKIAQARASDSPRNYF